MSAETLSAAHDPKPASFANDTIQNGGFQCSHNTAAIGADQPSSQPLHVAAQLASRVMAPQPILAP